MKQLFLLFSLLPLACLAQNLVPNPSFEDTVACPTATGQVGNCAHWLSYGETPDYLHLCASHPLLQVPSNYFGYQLASSGDAYLGLYSFLQDDHRETVGTQLIQPLQVGETYMVSFWAVLAFNGNGISSCASNNVGLLFSTVSYSENNPAPIDNRAHVFASSTITDSIAWVEVYGLFQADSAYEFISIGNFFDNSNTDTVQLSNGGSVAYYFIDDVCVIPILGDCDYINDVSDANERIRVSPNPVITEVRLEGLTPSFYSYSIANIIGIIVERGHRFFESIDFLSFESFPVGVYWITIQDHRKNLTIKIVKTTN